MARPNGPLGPGCIGFTWHIRALFARVSATRQRRRAWARWFSPFSGMVKPVALAAAAPCLRHAKFPAAAGSCIMGGDDRNPPPGRATGPGEPPRIHGQRALGRAQAHHRAGLLLYPR